MSVDVPAGSVFTFVLEMARSAAFAENAPAWTPAMNKKSPVVRMPRLLK